LIEVSPAYAYSSTYLVDSGRMTAVLTAAYATLSPEGSIDTSNARDRIKDSTRFIHVSPSLDAYS